MSGFGLLAILLFLVLMGGLVTLEYTGNSDLSLAKGLLLALYILTFFEIIFALYEYPAYVINGVVFICMGYKWLADVMFAILAAAILFALVMIIVKINWKRFLTPSMTKLIVTGIVLMLLLGYTELYNGAYSFDSMDEFRQVREMYEQYDNHFFPTKYIYHLSKEDNQDRISVLPFDVTTAAGKQKLLYKAETFFETYEDGKTEIFFYPFTWKLYEGIDPVSFNDTTYVPAEAEYEELRPPISSTDASQGSTTSTTTTSN